MTEEKEEVQEEQKTMSIKEFRELGFIQEINRNYLHPVGLALCVTIDEETGEEAILNVIDARDDDEGIYFAEEELDMAKYRSVADLFNAKIGLRKAKLGYAIQPMEKVSTIVRPGF